MGGLTEIKIEIGPEAYRRGQFVYVWFDETGKPIYVGQSRKSLADRVGLHICDEDTSGAIVAKIIRKRPHQIYSIVAFPLNQLLLNAVIRENRNIVFKKQSVDESARKAVERLVYECLVKRFPDIHKGTTCRWSAKAARNLSKKVMEYCLSRHSNP